LKIEQEILSVLIDTSHKSGFKLHVLVLQHLFCLAKSGGLTEPLWDVDICSYSNAAFVRVMTIKLLSRSFTNMDVMEVIQFVDKLFQSTNDLSTFKTYIQDFLIQSNYQNTFAFTRVSRLLLHRSGRHIKSTFTKKDT
jgi:exportin-1